MHPREEIVAKIHRYGGVTANALLNSPCALFEEKDGLIGYHAQKHTAIVLGDPVTDPDQQQELVEAFHTLCDHEKKEICYVLASQEFQSWASHHLDHCIRIECAEEFFLNPNHSPLQGPLGRLLRRKVKRAAKENTELCEYDPQADPKKEVRKSIERLVEEWLSKREGSQIHISHPQLFSDPIGKRWFYIKRHKTITGVVMLNALEKEHGWLLNHLLISKEAPPGSSEFLVIGVLDQLQSEGCSFLSLGALPKAALGQIAGLNRFSALFARGIFKTAQWFLPLQSRRKYWEKFHPESRPLYLVFNTKHLSLRALFDLKKALNISI